MTWCDDNMRLNMLKGLDEPPHGMWLFDSFLPP
jgi:hypothetical protein